MLLRVILRTWRCYFGILGDQFGDSRIHRDTSWDTLGVQTWISSILCAFGDPWGFTFGIVWTQAYDLGCGNGSWDYEPVSNKNNEEHRFPLGRCMCAKNHNTSWLVFIRFPVYQNSRGFCVLRRNWAIVVEVF